MEEVEKVAKDVCFIEDQDELMTMLDFYHDLGIIIKHGATVVLNAQWLIGLFKTLITIRPYDDQVSVRNNPMAILQCNFCQCFGKRLI